MQISSNLFAFSFSKACLQYLLSVMLYGGEAVRLVGRKPLKTSSSGESDRDRRLLLSAGLLLNGTI